MISAEMVKLLNETGNSLISEIKGNMSRAGQNATGKTAQSLRFVIKDGGSVLSLQVLGREFFKALETGRKATPQKMPSRAMIDNITEWVQAKGKPESAVWGIAMAIQKKGTRLFQSGGREDIFTNVVKDPRFIDELSKEILDLYAQEYAKNIRIAFAA